MLGLILIVPITFWIYRAASGPPAVTILHPSVRVMTWGGTSSIGYLRVELWSEQRLGHAPKQELRIYQTDGTVYTYRGAMVTAPRDKLGASDQREVFVRSSDHLLENKFMNSPTVLAAVSQTGVLRLFALGLKDGVALTSSTGCPCSPTAYDHS